MIIYDTTRTRSYEFIDCNTLLELRVLAAFEGNSRKDGWKPVHVNSLRATKREGYKLADLPYSHSALMMRPSGLEALRDVLEAHGEILPLSVDGGVEMWVHNVLGVLDAHDVERSHIRRSEASDRSAVIYEHAFLPAVIGDAEMFRTSVDPSRVYFTDRFVERVKRLKLKGTDFVPLWSSEGPLPKGKSK